MLQDSAECESVRIINVSLEFCCKPSVTCGNVCVRKCDLGSVSVCVGTSVFYFTIEGCGNPHTLPLDKLIPLFASVNNAYLSTPLTFFIPTQI